jgi:peptidoglycan hydrolase CwlO-like protein
LEEYLATRRGMQSQKEEINKVKSDITELKEDMADIKNLLQKLLEKGSNG